MADTNLVKRVADLKVKCDNFTKEICVAETEERAAHAAWLEARSRLETLRKEGLRLAIETAKASSQLAEEALKSYRVPVAH